MEQEISSCCTAARHDIYPDLCGDCQEWAEFYTEEEPEN